MIFGAIAFALLLGAFVFRVLPRGVVWQRSASAALFVLLVGLVYGGAVELMGQPKPMRLEWRGGMEEADVLGASMAEGEAIYVLLQAPDGSPPRFYEIPWTEPAAEALQQAMREGQENGTGVKMAGGGQGGQPGNDTREPMFYAEPQQALPDKNYRTAQSTDLTGVPRY
jgi:hypothetical protein